MFNIYYKNKYIKILIKYLFFTFLIKNITFTLLDIIFHLGMLL